MRRTLILPRILAALLSLSLAVPNSALALRTEQREHQSGLEEIRRALEDGHPDRLLERASTALGLPSRSATPTTAPLTAISPRSAAGLEEILEGIVQRNIERANRYYPNLSKEVQPDSNRGIFPFSPDRTGAQWVQRARSFLASEAAIRVNTVTVPIPGTDLRFTLDIPQLTKLLRGEIAQMVIPWTAAQQAKGSVTLTGGQLVFADTGEPFLAAVLQRKNPAQISPSDFQKSPPEGFFQVGGVRFAAVESQQDTSEFWVVFPQQLLDPNVGMTDQELWSIVLSEAIVGVGQRVVLDSGESAGNNMDVLMPQLRASAQDSKGLLGPAGFGKELRQVFEDEQGLRRQQESIWTERLRQPGNMGVAPVASILSVLARTDPDRVVDFLKLLMGLQQERRVQILDSRLNPQTARLLNHLAFSLVRYRIPIQVVLGSTRGLVEYAVNDDYSLIKYRGSGSPMRIEIQSHVANGEITQIEAPYSFERFQQMYHSQDQALFWHLVWSQILDAEHAHLVDLLAGELTGFGILPKREETVELIDLLRVGEALIPMELQPQGLIAIEQQLSKETKPKPTDTPLHRVGRGIFGHVYPSLFEWTKQNNLTGRELREVFRWTILALMASERNQDDIGLAGASSNQQVFLENISHRLRTKLARMQQHPEGALYLQQLFREAQGVARYMASHEGHFLSLTAGLEESFRPEDVRIAIVEDEEKPRTNLLQAVKQAIESSQSPLARQLNVKTQIAVFNNGNDAIPWIEAQKPHLVITDIVLGRGATGYDVAMAAKRANPKGIVVHESRAKKIPGDEDYFDRFIRKDWSKATIQKLIDEVIVQHLSPAAGLEEDEELEAYLRKPEVTGTGGKGIRARFLFGTSDKTSEARWTYDEFVQDAFPHALVPELKDGLSPLLRRLDNESQAAGTNWTWVDWATGLGTVPREAALHFPRLRPVLVDAVRWLRDDLTEDHASELEAEAARRGIANVWSLDGLNFIQGSAGKVTIANREKAPIRLFTMFQALSYNPDPLKILVHLYNQLPDGAYLLVNFFIPTEHPEADTLAAFYKHLLGDLQARGIADWKFIDLRAEHLPTARVTRVVPEYMFGMVFRKQPGTLALNNLSHESEGFQIQSQRVVEYQVAVYKGDLQNPLIFHPPAAGLEEGTILEAPVSRNGIQSWRGEMPGSLSVIISPREAPDYVRGFYQQGRQSPANIAVLFDRTTIGFLPQALRSETDDEIDRQLLGLSGQLKGALHLPENIELQLGLNTEQNRATYKEFRVIQVKSMQPIPFSALPVVVVDAVRKGEGTFWAPVSRYDSFKTFTMENVLGDLDTLFSA